MLLEKIHNPQDLRKLQVKDLPVVCEELRAFLLQKVAKVGGHLSSNLGTVELSVALHYVFNTPHDRILWDVGHQSYPHKVLTGRREQFESLRQSKGISGFTSRVESEYDAFGAGHASTAISAAVGMAEAFKHLKKKNFSIAVVGDGALTGGLAFEGMNNAGFNPSKNLLIIFNDNNMSIDPNVGALNQWIEKQKSNAPQNIANYFDSFGLKYSGPIDGHDMGLLMSELNRIKNLGHEGGPFLLHIKTIKGKGYAQAEELPIQYHGVTPFKVEEGIASPKIKKLNYQDVFAGALTEVAKKNPKVIAITAAMPSGTGLTVFQKEIPDRFYDVGIAEGHAVLFAAGLAAEGMRPVAAIYSTFLQRAYDQVIHDVCLQNLPVIFAMDRAGVVGADGATHQGAFDLTYLRTVPNLVLMAPKDENELQHMVATAVHYDKGPIAFRYPRGEVVGVPLDKDMHVLPIGKGELLHSDIHSEVVLIGIGYAVQTLKKVQLVLAREGISVSLINARFVKPLDENLILDQCENAKLVVTLEENAAQGGFGSAILELFSRENLKKQTLVLGMPDRFVDHATQAEQREQLEIDPNHVVQKILDKYHEFHSHRSLTPIEIAHPLV